jgi:rare lipoprotein A
VHPENRLKFANFAATWSGTGLALSDSMDTRLQEAVMNNDLRNESLLPQRPAWKRLLILTLSLLQSYLFVPAMAPTKFFALAAEAAESRLPMAGRGKRTQTNAAAERDGKRPESMMRRVLRGKASWYGPRFHGKKTANGDIFDQQKLTAAHKTLPLGTKAIVTNLENGNTVEVEINDRGPYVPGRVIDLSFAAAKQLGFIKSGIAPVEVVLLTLPQEAG